MAMNKQNTVGHSEQNTLTYHHHLTQSINCFSARQSLLKWLYADPQNGQVKQIKSSRCNHRQRSSAALL